MKLVSRFWMDDAGFVISTELVLVAVLLVLGLITGLATLRDQVVQELGDVAAAISEINQSFSFSGVTAHSSSTAGSSFLDLNDFCDPDGQGPPLNEPQCIEIDQIPATPEAP
jgi:Flp pilus assembly pilin Flp